MTTTPLASSRNARLSFPGVADDEAAIADLFAVWNDYMDRKLVLVCLLENKDELGDADLPDLVGCNLTGPKTAHEEHGEVSASP